jgi:hypothetical protein
MKSFLVVRVAAVVVLLLSPWRVAFAASEVIVLQSGFDEQNNVAWGYGQLDVGLTYVTTGSANLGFANPFTAADFAAAQSGPSAITKPPLSQGNFQIYVPSLFAPYPSAQWVNPVLDPLVALTTLYALPFQVASTSIPGASLSMKWAVDDWLGDPDSSDPNPIGVYLNGQPVPAAISGGTFALNTTAFDPNVGPLLVTGTNWLYLYQRDINAGASGLLFGATITIIPEPTSAGIACGLVCGILALLRRRGECVSWLD